MPIGDADAATAPFEEEPRTSLQAAASRATSQSASSSRRERAQDVVSGTRLPSSSAEALRSEGTDVVGRDSDAVEVESEVGFSTVQEQLRYYTPHADVLVVQRGDYEEEQESRSTMTKRLYRENDQMDEGKGNERWQVNNPRLLSTASRSGSAKPNLTVLGEDTDPLPTLRVADSAVVCSTSPSWSLTFGQQEAFVTNHNTSSTASGASASASMVQAGVEGSSSPLDVAAVVFSLEQRCNAALRRLEVTSRERDRLRDDNAALSVKVKEWQRRCREMRNHVVYPLRTAVQRTRAELTALRSTVQVELEEYKRFVHLQHDAVLSVLQTLLSGSAPFFSSSRADARLVHLHHPQTVGAALPVLWTSAAPPPPHPSSSSCSSEDERGGGGKGGAPTSLLSWEEQDEDSSSAGSSQRAEHHYHQALLFNNFGGALEGPVGDGTASAGAAGIGSFEHWAVNTNAARAKNSDHKKKASKHHHLKDNNPSYPDARKNLEKNDLEKGPACASSHHRSSAPLYTTSKEAVRQERAPLYSVADDDRNVTATTGVAAAVEASSKEVKKTRSGSCSNSDGGGHVVSKNVRPVANRTTLIFPPPDDSDIHDGGGEEEFHARQPRRGKKRNSKKKHSRMSSSSLSSSTPRQGSASSLSFSQSPTSPARYQRRTKPADTLHLQVFQLGTGETTVSMLRNSKSVNDRDADNAETSITTARLRHQQHRQDRHRRQDINAREGDEWREHLAHGANTKKRSSSTSTSPDASSSADAPLYDPSQAGVSTCSSFYESAADPHRRVEEEKEKKRCHRPQTENRVNHDEDHREIIGAHSGRLLHAPTTEKYLRQNSQSTFSKRDEENVIRSNTVSHEHPVSSREREGASATRKGGSMRGGFQSSPPARSSPTSSCSGFSTTSSNSHSHHLQRHSKGRSADQDLHHREGPNEFHGRRKNEINEKHRSHSEKAKKRSKRVNESKDRNCAVPPSGSRHRVRSYEQLQEKSSPHKEGAPIMVDRRRHTTQRATSPLRSTEWVSVREEEYRALQEGLAVAQRQLVELSRQHAYEQERYHLRLSQLEQVHSMRETTLKEELALLRRVHQNHLKRWNNAVAAPPDPVEPAPVEHCAAVGRSTTAEKENEHKSLRLHTDIGGGQWNGTGLEANAIRDLVERRRQLLLDAAWMTSHPHQAESLSARPSAAPQPAPPPAWNESASSQEQQRVVWSNLDNTVVENVRRDNGGQYARKVETSSVGEDASASVHLEPHFRVDELPPAGAAVVQAVVGGAWAPHGNLMRSGNYRASAAASVYPVAGGEAPSPLASGRIDANPPSCSVSVHSRLMTSTKPSTGTPHERYDIQEEDIEEARWKSATALGHNEQRPVRARRSISGGSISSLHTHQNESDNAAPTVPLSSATPAIHEPDFYRPVCDELFIAAARQLTHQNRKNQKLKKRTAFAASADDQLPPTPPLRGPQKVAKGHPASRSHSTGNMQEADKEVVKVAQGLWAEHMLSERRMRR